jgi:HK97 family phage major capsid protein
MPNDMAFDEVIADLKSEIKSHYENVDKKNKNLAEQIDVFKEKSATKEDLTDIKNRIEEQKAENEKIYDLLDKAEAKMQRGGGGGVPQSLGDMMIKSGSFDGMTPEARGSWSHTIEAKDITNLGNTQASPNRNVLVPEHNAGFLNPIDQPLSVRGLIPAGQTTSNVIQRTEEDVFTNNAAPVAEGATKPQSDITFKRGQVNVEKISHWIRVSSEVLSDAPMLRSYIDMRLRYGVDFKEEDQILNGNGTSPNLDGMLNTGNFVAYNNLFLTGVTPTDGVDDIRVAKEQVNSSFMTATGVILNHKDWAKIEMLKDGDGKYLHASVTTGLAPRLWGMRVAASHSIAEGKFHVGSYAMGAQIWDRWAMRVMASNEDQDNFVNNKVTILAEKRLALEVFRPNAFVYGDLT